MFPLLAKYFEPQCSGGILRSILWKKGGIGSSEASKLEAWLRRLDAWPIKHLYFNCPYNYVILMTEVIHIPFKSTPRHDSETDERREETFRRGV